MSDDELLSLLGRLVALDAETEWVEFKKNNANPQEIGEYLSALANSAALHRKDAGYIVWGVSDSDRSLSGTSFRPRREKVKGQELESWVSVGLEPRVDFRIYEFVADGKAMVIFAAPPAPRMPVRFQGVEYIRVGSYKKKLSDHVEKERALWALFSRTPFEMGAVLSDVAPERVLALIDYPSFFTLIGQDLPENRAAVLDRLVAERIIQHRGGQRFDVTGFGAILFARKLSDFDRLARKALRIIIYRGVSRLSTIKERVIDRGYAVGFEDAVRYINDQLPRNEQIGQAFRREAPVYPEIAIRELVANALIHQDFDLSGTSPMVELFEGRIEITNPGASLVEPLRLIDAPPLSRNEKIASIMRRMNICEERGSGIDKVIASIEMFQLPPLDFATTTDHTRATIRVYKKLADMDKKQKIWACYQHACLCHVSNEQMTNTSLRKRFAIADQNYSIASRIIADALIADLIKPHDPENTSKRHARYVPCWA